MLTQQTIADDLRRLGVRRHDALVVHSSLRSLGKVEGGAQAVIAALLDVIGPGGLLVLPTFTYWTQVFDPNIDPCLTGLIPETARAWPGAVRSLHPTHSVAAIGAGAETLCAGHHRVAGSGLGSPLDKLAARDGSILLLGVSHNTNSTIHVGEAHAAAGYLDIPFRAGSFSTATVITPGGPLEVSLQYPAGCSKAFGAVEKVLRDRLQVRDGMVGSSLAQRVKAQAVIAATVDILSADPAGLLCTDPHCYRCTQSRERLKNV
ncbi:MAG TPA: AAC(3) family N-acetyltransferase [Abditibacteriaceae bacterium]|nr:AAC(3) family N-acetyltransferase [Abditibacteriaceae bacterium]